MIAAALRPETLAVLRAAEEVAAEGLNPNCGNVGRRLGKSERRVQVHRGYLRSAGLWPWPIVNGKPRLRTNLTARLPRFAPGDVDSLPASARRVYLAAEKIAGRGGDPTVHAIATELRITVQMVNQDRARLVAAGFWRWSGPPRGPADMTPPRPPVVPDHHREKYLAAVAEIAERIEADKRSKPSIAEVPGWVAPEPPTPKDAAGAYLREWKAMRRRAS